MDALVRVMSAPTEGSEVELRSFVHLVNDHVFTEARKYMYTVDPHARSVRWTVDQSALDQG